MQTSYEVLVAEAEQLRVVEYRPAEAIEKYKSALEIGGPSDVECKQMIGVCYRLLHEYDEAIKWLRRALVENSSDYVSGKVLRDLAEAQSGLGMHREAFLTLIGSMEKLPYASHPSEFGASLGFLARVEMRLDNPGGALRDFRVADTILHNEGNRHMELYNKLHYASALSREGHWWRARAKSLASLDLANEYGARVHRIRALALLIGGWRLERYLSSFGK